MPSGTSSRRSRMRTLASRARSISRSALKPPSAVGRRRQLAQEVRAAVVDQEEMRALRVVGAAGGAPGHGEVGLRHHRRVGRRILEWAVRHRQAGAARHGDQDRLLELGERLARLGRLIAHAARQHRASLADAMCATPPDRLDQRPVEQRVEAGVAGRWRLRHDAPPAPGCWPLGTIGRHGANALAVRGSIEASSGQWRRIRLVMPLLAIQSMPNGE